MTDVKDKSPGLSRRAGLGLGAAALLVLGAAGGAGAVSMTRPTAEMAPTANTAIAKLSAGSGIVTVRGRVVEVYGDRFVIQDATGRTMVDSGPGADARPGVGQDLTVQGRFENGQLHASYLVGSDGRVSAVGPAGGPLHGPSGPQRPHPDAPLPPPPGGPDRDGARHPRPDCGGPDPLGEQNATPPASAPSSNASAG
ncbi:hypothetical protein [Sphingomonas sp.]|uniref:hypothetical protein n=1 Tax=Sphingomonas sp. TaxID=28214 RepID=UPI001B2155DE|nr:hypothetical protein [Sphingomonas sp.]MBO9713391.1 hypothetical protein [Sphingomonas sp.]